MTAQRIAVLASGWAGFNDAVFSLLGERGVELLVVFEDAVADTDYVAHRIGEHAEVVAWTRPPSGDDLAERLRQFAPDAVLMHSWHHRFYRTAMAALPGTTLRVLWMDNVWRSTTKQWVGRAVAPVWVRRLFDCVMVPSDRTEFFARRLGFGEADVIRGSLSADTTCFGSEPRDGQELRERQSFLTATRLVHHKGADVLAEAYARYRDSTPSPWALTVAGIGPLRRDLETIPGVELTGFCQPHELAELMRRSSCLVVPSREEPYGVTVHEGAVSGLPIVSTYFVGAVPMFVQDGANGWVVPGGDAVALADAMARVASQPAERLAAMSDVSRALGSRLSTEGVATHLQEELDRRLGVLRGS